MINLDLKFDILRIRPGQSITNYVLPDTSLTGIQLMLWQRTQRGNLLRRAFSEAYSGDTFILAPTIFDLDGKNKGTLLFPDNITLLSPGIAHLFSNVWSDNQGQAFEIKNLNATNIWFENQTWQTDEDGRTIEFYTGWKRTQDNAHYLLDANGAKVPDAPPSVYSATFHNCTFVGNAWVVYDWSSHGHHWRLEHCKIISGRQGVSMMGGSGNASVFCDLIQCTIDCDASRSQDVGWTSNIKVGGVYGVCARGGVVRVIDCEFNLRGRPSVSPSFTPRCVGIYDGNDFDSNCSDWTVIEVLNPRFYINGNGSTDVFDVFMTNQPVRDRLKLVGGYGSGPNGGFTKNW